MRARWEYGYEEHREDFTKGESLDSGWEPFAGHDGRVLLRRLVVARCEAGHEADFDDEACKEGVKWDGKQQRWLPCGKPIVAVPVDPYDVVGLSRNER